MISFVTELKRGGEIRTINLIFVRRQRNFFLLSGFPVSFTIHTDIFHISLQNKSAFLPREMDVVSSAKKCCLSLLKLGGLTANRQQKSRRC